MKYKYNFVEIVGKIGIFLKPKPQDWIKSCLEISWVQTAPYKSPVAVHGQTTFQKPPTALIFECCIFPGFPLPLPADRVLWEGLIRGTMHHSGAWYWWWLPLPCSSCSL